jgi:2-desacetyl-2-hydroxyethyl bacteriochlorophyllide A dehydrogenase
MKALVYTGPEQLEFRDVPDAVAGTDEVLVRIHSSGICGSDMHAYLGHDERRPAPLILGHEAAGTVVGGALDGKRVTINPLVTCQTCTHCRSGRANLCAKRQIISMQPREGAFTEWVAMPERNLVAIPDDLSFDKAALAEPLACGWHTVRLSIEALHGEAGTAKALVIGGGAIGLGAALALRAFGVASVSVAETNPLRWPALEQCGFAILGADTVPDAGFDLVIDGVGYAATRATACRAVTAGGVIGHIGLGESTGGLDVRRMTLQEITFIGTYTYTPDDFRATVSAIASGALGSLDWMQTMPLALGAEAFQDIRAGRMAAPKVILKP